MQTIVNQQISSAVYFLKKGELVGIPTETVYGLAGNALNQEVLVKIFQVKNRPFFDPLILHISQMDDLYQWATIPDERVKAIFQAFSPGPLTVLLPKKDVIPDLATSGLPTAAFRIPSHTLTRELLAALPFPLAAPSANPFGYVSPTTTAHVLEQLGGKIPMVLEGGSCEVGIESTIIGYEHNEVVIYREGGISREMIAEKFPDIKIRLADMNKHPSAPGMLKSHYAPVKPLFLFPSIQVNNPPTANGIPGVLSFCDAHPEIDTPYRQVLSPKANLEEAARNLFSAIRHLDQCPCNFIWAELLPEEGVGRAINDRLRKASFTKHS